MPGNARGIKETFLKNSNFEKNLTEKITIFDKEVRFCLVYVTPRVNIGFSLVAWPALADIYTNISI